MRGRPHLFTSYEGEQSLLPTWTQRVMLALFLVLLVTIPLQFVPGVQFLGSDSWLLVLNRVMIYAIGALGINILTGLAGQVSLGHAFFMGIGAYTAVVLGAPASDRFWGMGLPIWIWLPAAGIVAAIVGIIVAPTAVRVRGLYLAIVTLGLVFIGEHLFRNLTFITGGAGLGRDWPELAFRFWKEEEPLIDFSSRGPWFGIEFSGAAKTYFFMLVLLILFTLWHKNLARTRIGRAFQSIRDRDIAAEVMGVADAKNKLRAFAISSFFAGVAGALLGALVGRLVPETWNLLLSVQFVAIILIGGAGTTAGTLLGSFFVVAIPRMVEDLTRMLSVQVRTDGPFAWLGDFIIADQGDFGLVSTVANGPGLSIFQTNLALYGFLIIIFLIFEPLGLFGVWIRIRNYWKGWPFSY
ncbi:MAG: branched-chain amino acid ABC transporter permease [Actinobacteria bacterium]|nr:branched-chain amino acid ABC transporter permease [Actinomycetota bacterium]